MDGNSNRFAIFLYFRFAYFVFFQLVPIGTESMQQNGELTQEFVCVVTRKYIESENAHQNIDSSDRAQVLQQKAMRRSLLARYSVAHDDFFQIIKDILWLVFKCFS